MTIIVTRAEPDASAFAARLQSAGVSAIVSPAIEIEVNEIPVDSSGVGALAFTSSNGVRAFAQNNARRDLPVFAVGAATAQAANEAGFQTVLIADGDVDALAALIAEKRQAFAGAVLHVVGRDQAGDLAGALGRLGVHARAIVLYRAVTREGLTDAAQTQIAHAASDTAVAFFSPRTVKLFAALCERAALTAQMRRLTALCLSDAVAQEAGDAGFARARVARERTADAMVALACDECAPRA